MQLGKIGKSLTAALVGGALLWPASSAEKPSYENFGDYHQRPAVVYAAETKAKPAYKGIPNEIGECNYPTKMPVKVHYEKLPAGVDPKAVKVFDDKDLYHYGEITELGYNCKKSDYDAVTLWFKGDSMDILRSRYPDAITIEDIDGSVISSEQKPVIFVSRQIKDHYTYERARDGPNKIFYEGKTLGSFGEKVDNIKLFNIQTGKSVPTIAPDNYDFVRKKLLERNGNTDWLDNLLSSPHAGYRMKLCASYDSFGLPSLKEAKEVYFTVDESHFWCPNFKGLPSGDYKAEINTPNGTKEVQFKINNPNGPDPKIAMALGIEDFYFKDENIEFDLFRWDSPYNVYANVGRDVAFKLAGTVNIVFPDTLPKDMERSSMSVWLIENGIATKKLYETQLTHKQYTLEFDTKKLENSNHRLGFEFGHIYDHSAWKFRNIIVENQSTVASQPAE